MNKKLLRKIARHLEKKKPVELPDGTKVGFHMGAFVLTDASRYLDQTDHECGTTGCIAGWAVALGDPESFDPEARTALLAARLLELDYETAQFLFFGGFDLSTEEVAKVVRNLIKTGKVDWNVAG